MLARSCGFCLGVHYIVWVSDFNCLRETLRV